MVILKKHIYLNEELLESQSKTFEIHQNYQSSEHIFNDHSKHDQFINEIERNNNIETVLSPQQLKISVKLILDQYVNQQWF